METTRLDLAPQAAELARVVTGIRDDQLGDPTPCADTPVAGLLAHVVGLTTAFRMAAEKTPVPGGPSASPDDLPPDWRTRIPAQLDALVEAWQQPSAWEGTAEAGGLVLSAPVTGVVALDEVLVHGWDLAVATGQAYRPDPASAEACLEMVGDRTGATDEPEGLFGPVVPVPDGAPPFDRLPGQTGRDPRWTPPR